MRALCRPSWMALLPLVVLVTAKAQTAIAQARVEHELGANVELAAGYDSNPQLAVSPNARRDTLTSIDPGPGSSGVMGALANAYGMWGTETWIGAALSSDARLYHAGDRRHDTALTGFAGVNLGAHRLSLSAMAGRYDASFGLDNAWHGALMPMVRFGLAERWSLGAETHAGFRRYQEGAQLNWNLGGAFDLQLRQGVWLATLGVDLDARASNDALAKRTQVAPFLAVEARASEWRLALRYAAFARWFDAGRQNGIEHTAEISGQLRVASALWLTTRVGVGLAGGQSAALTYERVTAMLGLNVAWDTAAAASSIGVDRSKQGPARVRAGSTHFEVCREGAREVAVVGTFNDWSQARGQLQRDNERCFSGELSVPAGHHRYQWMIDGVLTRPDHAPAYVADDFGGEDAVLIVPD